MSLFEVTYKPFGERSILIEWPQIISENVLKSVLSYKRKLENFKFKEKVYIKSAYNSILITYDAYIDNFYDKIQELKQLYLVDRKVIKSTFKLWKIPVCYDLEFGIDLEEISNINNIEIPEIIRLHTNIKYRIFFLGFLPGFLYLGGLDKQLHFSRKTTPRLNVESGSVAIGGLQTGIYPANSPGGWNIIGKTPINFFDLIQQEPCFATAGDKIQFVSVSRDDYNVIFKKVDDSTYFLESEVIYD